ncbi:methanogenesis marker 3 protein [Methanolapillus millepedarum]|uniref:UPF0288 protein MsAc7_08790 n=1 Tax=Methanolapillus millepedarum TaxID=3028296 RepID=A0AA96V2I7_9EURY|nr:hypothetical protein MsAc7_08790 [Methanosarcinaceae archaeon Ac7]
MADINVEIDGIVKTVKAGATLADAVPHFGHPYAPGASICIVKKKAKEDAVPTKEFTVKTSKGVLVIEIKDLASVSAKIWLEKYKGLKYPVLLENQNAVSFGPFECDYDVSRGNKRYRKYDVLLGAGGFDPSQTTLIVCKKEHYAEYGTPADGVFATLVAGRTNLEKLQRGDVIESIEPYVKEESALQGFCTSDLSAKLEDGDRLITFAEIELSAHSPTGAETFYALTKDGTFQINSTAFAFRSDDTLKGEPCEYENFEPRKIGAVSLRTAGTGRGRIYISTANRASSLLHSVIGHVIYGMELPYFSGPGSKFSVETSPPHIMLLGHTIEESKELLDSIGIKFTHEGYDGPDNVIVQQMPVTSLEVLQKGEVVVTAVPKSKLIEVEFYYDLAPKTIEFFRHAIELKTKPIGALPSSMIYDDTYIFKAEKQAEKYKEIMPENVPTDIVKACDLGITNQSAKRMGYVGVRLVDETMFGPTGEKFGATNIIGKVLNPDNLRNLKEGDRIYIKEIYGESAKRLLLGIKADEEANDETEASEEMK